MNRLGCLRCHPYLNNILKWPEFLPYKSLHIRLPIYFEVHGKPMHYKITVLSERRSGHQVV